jgi:dipeptidyl-peptidase-4
MTTDSTRPRFPIEAIPVVPAPGMALPTAFAFTRDGATLTYLMGTPEDPTQRLFALDTTTGNANLLAEPPGGGTREETLTLDEELRRQRERSLAVGFTACARAEQSDRMLLPLGRDLYVLDGPGQPLRKVLGGDSSVQPITPTLSPDGDWIAYVADREIFVLPAGGGTPRQLTSGARERGRMHGLAEFIAQEELSRRDGFWWSRDSRWIAFAEVDESPIPLYVIPHQGSETTGPDAQEAHHYPFAGGPNALVRLAVIPIEGGTPVWMDLDFGEELYLARVFWWRDGDLGAVVVNRPQNALSLVRFDRASGRRRLVLEERNDCWINLPLRCLEQLENGSFVWASERNGYRHLYLYAADGTLQRPLTSGTWMVDEIVGVDERRRCVYFTGNREDPREKYLYAVDLGGHPTRRLTGETGTHEVTLDATAGWFVDVHSAVDSPPSVTMRSLESNVPSVRISLPPDPRLDQFQLEPPELVTLHNRSGTSLYGALYRPPAGLGAGPFPTIVHVYGGPGAQLVTNSWGRMTAALDIQYLRSLGYLVFRLDNRGSARRGSTFEQPLYRQFGRVEVEDQLDGVRWLTEQGLADASRIGIYGWSYGGYMTLMCLAKAPKVFKVGIAGAPVTDQGGYDTAYTERYLETPQSNPDGYRESSVLIHATTIRGKLLLVHGMLDENVHFRHTARLINEFIRTGQPYDLALFPDERHLPRRVSDRIYLQSRIIGYFRKHL